MERIKAYLMLMRLHRPIPILLLLWPTYWSLWLVSEGFPGWKLLCVFTLGVVIVRTLGCIINDLSDINFDRHVKRTKNRPLAAGLIKPLYAWLLFFVLGIMALILVSFLNLMTIYMSFGALALTVIYPLCKRFFSLPQLVLGATYNYGILMASTAIVQSVSLSVLLLYLAAIIWTLAYDTIYALADKPYDIKLGLKSSAVTFGHYDTLMILLLQQVFIIILFILGVVNHFSLIFYLFLIVSELLFLRQYRQYTKRDINSCIKAFSNNHWIGLAIFIGIGLQFLNY